MWPPVAHPCSMSIFISLLVCLNCKRNHICSLWIYTANNLKLINHRLEYAALLKVQICLNTAADLGRWGRRGRCGVCYWPGRCRCRVPRLWFAPSQCEWKNHCCCCWAASRACPVTTGLFRWKGYWSGSARLCGSPAHQSDICEKTERI